MRARRQKRQLELPFFEAGRGEAPSRAERGTESLMARAIAQDPTSTRRLMEEVADEQNMMRAMEQVMKNKGCPGVDGMKVSQLPRYYRRHGQELRQQLLQGTYQPQPVLQVTIPKDGGGERKLGIPTVVDRLVQQALLQVLQPRWDPSFSPYSYGFRPGRSAHQAVAQAQEYIEQGYGWVVDIDLEKFFDRVNHDKLMGQVAKRVEDKRVLRLIRAFLNAGILANGLVEPSEEGVPQGGPLSPLLSNLVLDQLDRELERRGHRFVRYADDCNIYVRSQRAAHRVMESISRFITRRLKLKVNQTKSAVDRPYRRKFLGFSFTPGRKPRRKLAPKTVKKFKYRVRQLTRTRAGKSLQQCIQDLNTYLRGWAGYFGYCQTPRVLQQLDGWIRRRVRNYAWRQWANGKNRYKRLRRLGVGHEMAKAAAGSNKGSWRMSRTQALQQSLSNRYLHDQLNLFSLASVVEA